ncbi:MAG TPA: carbon-nitrogen hydrolase family protein [Dehalococcoidia bacterium]|nr:carbon-nitrogen hydrolase family protein [Dehalococcoidia bacterium]
MTDKDKPFKIAAVQASPIFMDREATIDKACALIAEAAKNGARIIVFPEAFVPTYPDWVWVLPPGRAGLHRQLYGELLAQSVDVPSAATDRLGRAAKAAGVYVVIGVNERNVEASGASLYNTILYFGPDGALLGKHRKLMPTSAERLVWAAGDGSTLDTYDTPFGRLGGLICWENYMPLARYAMYAWGTQLYFAPTWDSSDSWLATLRHIAKEGRVYVVGCCIAMRCDQIPDAYEFKELYPADHVWVNVGNTAIAGPDGDFIAGPIVQKEEILYADVDPNEFRAPRYWFDPAGHYARPDVFQLTVNRVPNPMLRSLGGTPAAASGDGAPPTQSESMDEIQSRL